jgi:hypothetical protein
MKKITILIILGLILCIQPVVFAKTICFAGGGGATGIFWYFSGGKVDQKPFSGNLVAGSITIPSWASIITDSVGNLFVSLNNAHDPTGGGLFTSVWISASGPSTLSLSGQYDNQQNGTFEGPLTLTEVNCSSIPTVRPDVIRPAGAVGVPEKSQK